MAKGTKRKKEEGKGKSDQTGKSQKTAVSPVEVGRKTGEVEQISQGKKAVQTPVIFGLAGTELTGEETVFFPKVLPTGFILFSRNIESADQLKSLTGSLRGMFPGKEILIFTDQEGGWVQRIKPPVGTKAYPAAETFAKMYETDKEGAKAAVRENYTELTTELRSFGIDSPCAPVCDLLFDGADRVIGDRSFGRSAEQVVDLAGAAIDGIKKGGGIPCLKHIPGHGRAGVDSHYYLPVVIESLKVLKKTDFAVFKALASKASWAMIVHIVFEVLDASKPATTSSKVVYHIREEIGFKETLVTDDLGMLALHGEIGQKHGLLKSVILLASQGKEWREKYQDKVKQFFGVDLSDKNDEQVVEWAKKQQTEVHPLFCKSLGKVAGESLGAGCDIVLHCSGDMSEMEAVYGGICTYMAKGVTGDTADQVQIYE